MSEPAVSPEMVALVDALIDTAYRAGATPDTTPYEAHAERTALLSAIADLEAKANHPAFVVRPTGDWIKGQMGVAIDPPQPDFDAIAMAELHDIQQQLSPDPNQPAKDAALAAKRPFNILAALGRPTLDEYLARKATGDESVWTGKPQHDVTV